MLKMQANAELTSAPEIADNPQDSRFPFGWLLVALLAVIAAALRFHALAVKSFWLDEGVSVEIARLDWYNFARILWRREANMALYYLLLRGWLKFGDTEFFVRSLSILPALAMLPVLYWLGRKLFDRRTGLIAAALFTVNAYSIRYSQEARSYSLYILLATASCAAFIAFLDSPIRRNRFLHVAASVLAVYAHFYAALIVAAQWVSARILGSRPEQLRRNWIWIAVLSSPVLVFAAATGVGPLAWIQRPGLKTLYKYYDHMAGNGGPILLCVTLLCCLAALAPVATGLLQKSRSRGVWRFQFLLAWLLLPVLSVVAVSLARPMFVARYFVACLPAFLLLVAAGLRRLPQTWMQVAALIVVIAFSARGARSYYHQDFDLGRDDWRGATSFIVSHSQPGDVIIFHLAIGRMPYEYYKSLSPQAVNTPMVVFPSRGASMDYRDFIGKPSVEFLKDAAGKYSRVWVVLKDNQTRGGPDQTTRALDQLFRTSYAHVDTADFAGLEVRIYY